jgi:hypothetical protein
MHYSEITGRLWTICILVLSASVLAIQAPYITSAEPIDDQSVTINWRDNSTQATRFIICRSEGAGSYFAIDTINNSMTSYTDIGLAPGTTYSYFVKAGNDAAVSVESNTVSVTTMTKINRFGIPVVSPVYLESENCVKVEFYDSCNNEQSFRLYRSHNFGPFQLLKEQRDTLQLFMGWRSFNDSAVVPDAWYTYLVRVTSLSDSLSSFSVDLYTHKNNHSCRGIQLLKKSTFSSHPIGWAEVVGDSIYILENAGANGDAVAVINVADPQTPAFVGYIYPGAIPDNLSATHIPALLNLKPGNQLANKSKILFYKDRCFSFQADTLKIYSYDGQQLLQSVICPMSIVSLVGIVSDTVLLIQTEDLETEIFSLIALSLSGSSPLILSSFPMGHYSSWDSYVLRGVLQGKAYFVSSSCHSTCGGDEIEYFHIYDYSLDPASPLQWSIDIKPNFSSFSSVFLDSCVAIHSYFYKDTFNIAAFDARNSLYPPGENYLSIYKENLGDGPAIQNVVADTAKKRIFVLYTDSTSVYSYIPASDAIGASFPRTTHSPMEIIINNKIPSVIFRLPSSINSSWLADIIDPSGRIVYSFSGFGRNGIWNGTDRAGNRVSGGTYILYIKTNDAVYAKRLLLVR